MDGQQPGQGQRIFGISISPDGNTLVLTNAQTAAAFRVAPSIGASTPLWQAETGVELYSEFSPDGSVVAVSGDGRQLLAADTGAALFPRSLPTAPQLSAGCGIAYYRFSHDGRRVAGTNYDYGVEIYDIASLELLATLPSAGCSSGAAFSPDDDLIATGQPELYRTDDSTRLWPQTIGTRDTNGFDSWSQFTKNGDQLVVSTCDGVLECHHEFYSAKTGVVVGSAESTRSFAVLSRDGRFFVGRGSVEDRIDGSKSLLRAEADIDAAVFAPNDDIIAAVADGSVHRFCAQHG
jgi:WD40 repeat protein